MAVEAEKDILGNVARVLTVADQPPGRPQNRLFVFGHEFTEGGFIARSRPFNQTEVFRYRHDERQHIGNRSRGSNHGN